MTSDMGEALKHGLMAVSTLAHGRMTCSMGMECRLGLVVQNMKESSRMTRSMAKALGQGLMAVSTLAHGRIT
jgi:hypothetical protein